MTAQPVSGVSSQSDQQQLAGQMGQVRQLGLGCFQGIHQDRTYRVYYGQTRVDGMGQWQCPPDESSVPGHDCYGRFNLALHVGDDPQRVQANRLLLQQQLQPLGASDWVWLNQVHGTAVYCPDTHQLIGADSGMEPVSLSAAALQTPAVTADASVTSRPGRVLTSLTADCLPVVLVAAGGSIIGIAHAGWRGLQAGVIEQTAQAMPGEPVFGWLGAAIGPASFEVGAEVRTAFLDVALSAEVEATQGCFQAQANGSYLADLYQLARLRLARLGVAGSQVLGGGYDTMTQKHYFSYRRQPVTGRMVSVAFIQPE